MLVNSKNPSEITRRMDGDCTTANRIAIAVGAISLPIFAAGLFLLFSGNSSLLQGLTEISDLSVMDGVTVALLVVGAAGTTTLITLLIVRGAKELRRLHLLKKLKSMCALDSETQQLQYLKDTLRLFELDKNIKPTCFRYRKNTTASSLHTILNFSDVRKKINNNIETTGKILSQGMHHIRDFNIHNQNDELVSFSYQNALFSFVIPESGKITELDISYLEYDIGKLTSIELVNNGVQCTVVEETN